MIEVVRIVGNNIIPLFRVDGNRIDNITMAKKYGLDGYDEETIKKMLSGNPYLGWRDIK